MIKYIPVELKNVFTKESHTENTRYEVMQTQLCMRDTGKKTIGDRWILDHTYPQ